MPKTKPPNKGHAASHNHSTKIHSISMDHVKIKRVKRNKKQVTTKEKILAGLGVGGSLLGGIGAVAPKTPSTQIVTTQGNDSGSAGSKVKGALNKIFGSAFGIEKAKAADDSITVTDPNGNEVTAYLWPNGNYYDANGYQYSAPSDASTTATNNTQTDQQTSGGQSTADSTDSGTSTNVNSSVSTVSSTPTDLPAAQFAQQLAYSRNADATYQWGIMGWSYYGSGDQTGGATAASTAATPPAAPAVTPPVSPANDTTASVDNSNAQSGKIGRNLSSSSTTTSVTAGSASTTTYDPSVDAQITDPNFQSNLISQISAGQVQTINGNSVTAYMYSAGGSFALGETKDFSGQIYTFDGSNWQLGAPEQTSGPILDPIPTSPIVPVAPDNTNLQGTQDLTPPGGAPKAGFPGGGTSAPVVPANLNVVTGTTYADTNNSYSGLATLSSDAVIGGQQFYQNESLTVTAMPDGRIFANIGGQAVDVTADLAASSTNLYQQMATSTGQANIPPSGSVSGQPSGSQMTPPGGIPQARQPGGLFNSYNVGDLNPNPTGQTSQIWDGSKWVDENTAAGMQVLLQVAGSRALTPYEQQLFNSFYTNGQNAGTIPSTFGAGTQYAYDLGLGNGTATDGTTYTTRVGKDGKTYNLVGGNWVAAAAGKTATTMNFPVSVTSNIPGNPSVGDSWSITVTGTPGAAVSVHTNAPVPSSSDMGVIGDNGSATFSGKFSAGDLQNNAATAWQEDWSVGGQSAGSISFTVNPVTTASGTVTPATAATPPANMFVDQSLLTQTNTPPTGEGRDPSTQYVNQTYYASQAGANWLAQQFGGTVVSVNTNYDASNPYNTLSNAAQSQLFIKMPDGTLVNAGLMLQYYNQYSPAEAAQIVENQIALTQQQTANPTQTASGWTNNANYIGKPANAGYTQVISGPTVGSAATSISFSNNTTGNTNTLNYGDSWTINISGPAGTPIYLNGQPYIDPLTGKAAVIGSNGLYTASNIVDNKEKLGAWNEVWSVGSSASAQTTVGTLQFNVVNIPSTTVSGITAKTTTSTVTASAVLKNRNGAVNFGVGDTWEIDVFNAPPNTPIYATGGQQGGPSGTTYLGTTDGKGYLQAFSPSALSANQAGNWTVNLQIGQPGSAQSANPQNLTSINSFSFTVAASAVGSSFIKQADLTQTNTPPTGQGRDPFTQYVNQQYYATQDAAAALASQFGGKVITVNSNYDANNPYNTLSTAAQTQYFIQFPDGTQIDAGQLAYYMQNNPAAVPTIIGAAEYYHNNPNAAPGSYNSGAVTMADGVKASTPINYTTSGTTASGTTTGTKTNTTTDTGTGSLGTAVGGPAKTSSGGTSTTTDTGSTNKTGNTTTDTSVAIGITTTGLASAKVGIAYSQAVNGSNLGSSALWRASGLPAGLMIDPSSGMISGTPTTATSAAGVTVVVTVVSGTQSSSKTYNFYVAPQTGANSTTDKTVVATGKSTTTDASTASARTAGVAATTDAASLQTGSVGGVRTSTGSTSTDNTGGTASAGTQLSQGLKLPADATTTNGFTGLQLPNDTGSSSVNGFTGLQMPTGDSAASASTGLQMPADTSSSSTFTGLQLPADGSSSSTFTGLQLPADNGAGLQMPADGSSSAGGSIFTAAAGDLTTAQLSSGLQMPADGSSIGGFNGLQLPMDSSGSGLQMPGGSLASNGFNGLELPAGANDLSARYANVNGTIYDKATGHGFATPAEFFAAAGVSSFDGLVFDTNWTPGSQAASSTMSTYKVKKGDTLYGIAQKVYGKGNGKLWRNILSANPKCLSIPGNTKTLKIGAVLTIPSL